MRAMKTTPTSASEALLDVSAFTIYSMVNCSNYAILSVYDIGTGKGILKKSVSSQNTTKEV